MDSNRNTALLRTAAAFCHPVTIAAVALMLLNDHLFKAWWPGWWTGKLSDAAWVTFAPLFVALTASFLLPRRLKRRDSLVLWLSLSVTAVSYFLFNSWDPFHGLVNGFFSHIAGWGTVEKDPTDSIALAALALTWWVWWRPISLSTLRTRALVVGTVAVLATAATGPYRLDLGVSYVAQDGERLVAASQYQGSGVVSAYTSLDGGLTWAPLKPPDFPTLTGKLPLEKRILASDSARYRFLVGESVERSDDGGATWRTDYDVSKISGWTRRLFYDNRVPPRQPEADIHALPVPLDAAIDTTSGNLVLAMGQDGVLARTPDGQWTWATVGPYRLEPIGPMNLLSLVYAEFLIAIVFVVLSLATTLRALKQEGTGSLIVLLLTWSWLFFVMWSLSGRVMLSSVMNMEIAYVFMSLPALVGSLVAIRLTGPVTHGRAGLSWRIAAAMVVEYVLFMAPLVLWSQGLIPEYGTAVLLAVILGLIWLGAAIAYLFRYQSRTRHGEAAERGRDGQ